MFFDEITLPHTQVKQLYIKWNEKIDISVKEIIITNNTQKKQTPKIKYQLIDQYLQLLKLSSNWFESITIEKITYNNTATTSFKYRENEKGFLITKSQGISIESYIYFQGKYLVFDIAKLSNKQTNSTLRGKMYFDATNLQLYSKLFINIEDALKGRIYLKADTHTISYAFVSDKKYIKNFKDVIKLFSLPEGVKYWALDAIDAQALSINKLYGLVDLEKPALDALKHVYIQASLKKLNYKYHKDLDTIHTDHTDLEFKNGIFYIYPKMASSYNIPLGTSWIKIDFTKKEELLTLNLLFDGKLNHDVLGILKAYKINLPFLQHSGVVKTDLQLNIGLRKINVDAHGIFYTKKANFDYLGLNLDIADAKIKLDNYDVLINNMDVTYKELAQASVDVIYNAKQAKGTIKLDLKHVITKEISLLQKHPASVTYNISPLGDTIEVQKTKWLTSIGNIVTLEAFHIPFDLKTLLIHIPTTYYEIDKNLSNGFVTGRIDLKDNTVDINADILSINYDSISLAQTNALINIKYDDKLYISSQDPIILTSNDFDFTLTNLDMVIDPQKITLKHTDININNFLTAKMYANYNFSKKQHTVRLRNLQLRNKNNNHILYEKARLVLKINHESNTTKVVSKELRTDLTLDEKTWELNIHSLRNISRDSKILKQLSITDGEMKIYKRKSEDSTQFTAHINHPYKLFLKEDKHIENYSLSGTFYKKYMSINLNDVINIKVDDSVKITSKNIGIDMDELIRFTKESNQNDEEKAKSDLNVLVDINESYLLVSGSRKILADSLKIQYVNDIITAQLKHKKGSAGFKLHNKKFHVYGKDFGDIFMENLFTLSKFKDGSLSFSIDGNVDEYNGIFYIDKTTIVDYKLLNNILAFINTVPSLMTFSLPSYNKDGLFVKNAYMKFHAKDGHLNFTDFYLDSDEIDIVAKGEADIKKDSVNLILNLKTDLGSQAAKIPIVGYILLGKDTISKTMRKTGKLSDPTVKSLIAKDIVVAPVNIIKRTLLFPYELFKSSKETNATK